ncbi:MAG: TonB-dependent receptor [Bacteroidia bacterium]|nr:TonB-dependent receptor [Bacteroidia bacterium]
MTLMVALTAAHAARTQTTAKIEGKIVDDATNEALAGVTIRVGDRGTYSDENGYFSLSSLVAGPCRIKFELQGYRPDSLETTLTAGKILSLNLRMVAMDVELDAVKITADRASVEANDVSIATLMRMENKTVVALGKQQIARTQDRDAAQILRRIPGLSLNGGRFVMVRGLNERYNAVLLNGAWAPSAEPDVKAFSFDAVSAGAIERIVVAKSPSPELPGEFAGGVIQIHTLSIAERNVLQLGYGMFFREGTTFNDFYADRASKWDFFAGDFGQRTLKSNFPADLKTVSPSERAAASRSLPNTWAPKKSVAGPDHRFSALFARNFKLRGFVLSIANAFSHSFAHLGYNARRINYLSPDETSAEADTANVFDDRQYNRNARFGWVCQTTLKINDRHSAVLNVLYNRSGQSEVTLRQTRQVQRGNEQDNTNLRFLGRDLLCITGGMRHYLQDDRLQIQWLASVSGLRAQEPDNRRMTYVRPLGSQEAFRFSPGLPNINNGGRFWSKTQETIWGLQADVQYVLRPETDALKAVTLKSGLLYQQKTRLFSARWGSYNRAKSSGTPQFDPKLVFLPLETIFAPENVNDSTGYVFNEGTRKADAYSASNHLSAAYVMADWPLSRRITISGGVRVEYNRQALDSWDVNANPVAVANPIFSPLPSVNAVWYLRKNHQIRAGAGLTVNRPEFREFAPFPYYDYYLNLNVYGNPKLKTPTIVNGDLRWEWYPAPGEMITAGVFAKRFFNPVEWYFIPGVSGNDFTFDNAAAAANFGVEVDVRKSFDMSPRHTLTIVTNATYTYGRVELGERAVAQNPDRIMQGLSPFLANAGLIYEHKKLGFEAGIFYNVFAKRLFIVGSYDNPDAYEMPRHEIDAVLTQKIAKRWNIRLSVQDLFNQAFWVIKDQNSNSRYDDPDDDFIKYRQGRYYGISIHYTL